MKCFGRSALAATPSERCFNAAVWPSEFRTAGGFLNPHRITAGKTPFLKWLACVIPKRCERAVGTDRAIPSTAHRAQIEVKRHEVVGVLAYATELKWTERAFIHQAWVFLAHRAFVFWRVVQSHVGEIVAARFRVEPHVATNISMLRSPSSEMRRNPVSQVRAARTFRLYLRRWIARRPRHSPCFRAVSVIPMPAYRHDASCPKCEASARARPGRHRRQVAQGALRDGWRFHVVGENQEP